MEIDSTIYNLPPRTKLRTIGKNHIAIVKLIKNRIIQKDAIKIVEMSKQIKNIQPELKVSLICTSAICSKSLLLSESEGIPVVIEEL